ncbi:hypothetical protein LOD99_2975 [Oopsacas minuta]|uniref:Uncharacterized protein n=1 Tax=Oopsacas minuta TaxID=111878 RepID=A0AAV7K0L6_9METZ|nr:hypothetical protein LOD99_2975 [Oopsacas minuta]
MSSSRSLLATATRSQSPQSTQVLQTPPIAVIPTIQPVEARITIVAVVATCCLLILITVLLILILYLIAVKMKSHRLKHYANFPTQDSISPLPVERVLEHIVEDSKYNPVYISDSIRGRDSFGENNEPLQIPGPGQTVKANQDYFQPGRERESPIFLKGDTIFVRKIEGDVHKGQNMAWLRGEVAGREVCFPSYVINIVDGLEDTFDTFSTPLRRPGLETCAAQDSAVSLDSAPAELESLFHDVDFTLTQHSSVQHPLSRQEVIKQRHYSHSDISYTPHHRAIKRPTRPAPAPPTKESLLLPHAPSKLNRPKLSSKKKGSKDTDELLFVPPPLSSSTPLRHTGDKSHLKRTRGFIRHKRPDTPDTKFKPKPKNSPLVRKGRPLPHPVDPPSRPDPPYTPSTLSLILYADTQDDPPMKPPPPTTYESKNTSNF